MNTEKRFKRFLLDGGFWFDEYVPPKWAISDSNDKNSPITFLEFQDEYKDLCDKVVDFLNNQSDKIDELEKENQSISDNVYDFFYEHWHLLSEDIRHDAHLELGIDIDYEDWE